MHLIVNIRKNTGQFRIFALIHDNAQRPQKRDAGTGEGRKLPVKEGDVFARNPLDKSRRRFFYGTDSGDCAIIGRYCRGIDIVAIGSDNGEIRYAIRH